MNYRAAYFTTSLPARSHHPELAVVPGRNHCFCLELFQSILLHWAIPQASSLGSATSSRTALLTTSWIKYPNSLPLRTDPLSNCLGLASPQKELQTL